MVTNPPALAVADIDFGYRRGHRVFSNFSADFPPGITYLLGPNGAGKSTLLALAAGALVARRGVIRTSDGAVAGTKDYLRQVGWVPQRIDPIRGFSVLDQVAYAGWLKGLGLARARQVAAQALAHVDLDDRAMVKSDYLSGGQLRRLGIACALVHNCQVLLLDEPTAGLDPAQRVAFRDLLGAMRGSVDIVIATHQTEDLVDIADHVVVIAGATIVFSGSVVDYLELASGHVSGAQQAEAAFLNLVPAARNR